MLKELGFCPWLSGMPAGFIDHEISLQKQHGVMLGLASGCLIELI